MYNDLLQVGPSGIKVVSLQKILKSITLSELRRDGQRLEVERRQLQPGQRRLLRKAGAKGLKPRQA